MREPIPRKTQDQLQPSSLEDNYRHRSSYKSSEQLQFPDFPLFCCWNITLFRQPHALVSILSSHISKPRSEQLVSVKQGWHGDHSVCTCSTREHVLTVKTKSSCSPETDWVTAMIASEREPCQVCSTEPNVPLFLSLPPGLFSLSPLSLSPWVWFSLSLSLSVVLSLALVVFLSLTLFPSFIHSLSPPTSVTRSKLLTLSLPLTTLTPCVAIILSPSISVQ